MLKDFDVIATVAVKDLAVAKPFYRDTLGLQLQPGDETEALSFKSGNSSLLVYRSRYAGTNQATAANWAVDDVKGTVAELKAKGVKFEHYDFPGGKREGDVHIMDGMHAAWFRDPDGNILSIVSRQ